MKKKATIGKKMSFNKTTIAQLNTFQQTLIAGGMLPITRQIECLETRQATCVTIPYTQEVCVFC
ncbi:class I lanthipeptide [Chitinophaga oryzae]|uniref:Class I lanthipeptide n=1 Tax=Chitinophaga oryzae TaxID=2725414 RepID=A0AAE7D6K6_9BACT|nr:class I lanthipeptide [Chitinophaga oryzae]QJB31830.1 class I lanthipeptide [Chitinophaga oryzae]QJB38308.1 class I lanthipeptide [Chitinophaga oryzae]